MLKTMLFLAAMLAPLTTDRAGQNRTRLAVIGLDHDHVWGLLADIAKEPDAELVAIADPHPELMARARARVPASVRFYDDYVKMLDEPVENPVAAPLNVGVVEILDAAKESIRTGRAVELPR